MNEKILFEKKFYFLGADFLREIMEVSDIRTLPPKTELIKEGEYIKIIPVLLSGLVKTFAQVDGKEILLYYIQPGQSCIMSFSSSLKNEPSRIFAVTEEESELLLIPSDKISKWVITEPSINLLFYEEYNQRYSEMLDTVRRLLYDKLDKRLFDYLCNRVKITGKNPVKFSHRDAAHDLGTAREVVSRLIRKLESQNLVRQENDLIHIYFPQV